jgi:hypothetical protein
VSGLGNAGLRMQMAGRTLPWTDLLDSKTRSKLEITVFASSAGAGSFIFVETIDFLNKYQIGIIMTKYYQQNIV